MTDNEMKQVKMHSDFFERCEFAIESGYYLEAILMEYAAIESRLEAICGVLSFPCGRDCDCRERIMISDRIECLRVYRNKNKNVFSGSKLPDNFFTGKGKLKTWILERNKRVHGLYKNEEDFQMKIDMNRKLAEDGYTYARLLYNETKRLRRLRKGHIELFDNAICKCKNENCNAYIGD